MHVRLAVVGGAGAGSTTVLRALHAACEPASRGGCVPVPADGQGRGGFDVALLDLPAVGDRALRLHALTLPSGPTRREARGRLLEGTHGVLFVADLAPGGWAATTRAWHELDVRLRRLEAAWGPLPVAVLGNRADLADPPLLEDWLPRLWREGARRSVVAAGVADASRAQGLHEPFVAVVEAAVWRLLPRRDPGGAGRRAFREALHRQLAVAVGAERAPAPAADGLARAAPPARDGQPAWMRWREAELRSLDRERAYRRLLLDVGNLCAAAEDLDPLLHRTLRQLVLGLDAADGAIGLDLPGLTRLVTPRPQPGPGDAALAALAPRLIAGLQPPAARRIRLEAGAPLGDARRDVEGYAAPFAIGPGGTGWMILALPPGVAACEEGEGVLGPALRFLGLAVGRLVPAPASAARGADGAASSRRAGQRR